ncbi:MAG TPA: AIPR family protein [Thermoleophilia bacterium]|nr:AIPR family protein [Thermoleophilia bacterium]
MFTRSYLVGHLQGQIQRLRALYPTDRSKALVHWVVRLIDPGQTDDTALQIAARGGSGDAKMDAIWEHSEGKTLCVLQAKATDDLMEQDVDSYEEEEDEELPIETFTGEAVTDLRAALDLLLHPPSTPSDKLQRAIGLYEEARRSRKDIKLYPVVFGNRGVAFDREVRRLAELLDSDRVVFSKHSVLPVDISTMNEMLDRNFETPPGTLQLPTGDWAHGPAKVTDGLYIGLVPALDLVALRKEKELRIYHTNFRFMLGHTTVYGGMRATLKDEQERKLFHLYHNGITILGHDVSVPSPGQLKIRDLQVVNGLQTIETLYEFAQEQRGDDGPDRALSGVSVFVRFIDVDVQPTAGSTGRPLDERIAEYSNKQNPIKNRDLRSNDLVQKRLQHEIDGQGYKYERKRGQIHGKPRNKIDNEKAAQYALSFWLGQPAEAKNKKALLFVRSSEDQEGFYDQLFSLNVSASALLIPHEVFMRRPEDRSNFGSDVISHGGFVLLAMFGDVFKTRYRMDLRRASLPQNRETLSKLLTMIRDDRISAQVSFVYRQLLSRLKHYTNQELRRREREAEDDGGGRPSVRNVLFNLNYPAKKSRLLPRSVLARLASRLPPA